MLQNSALVHGSLIMNFRLLGTGTIADALEVRVAQIIVANPSLMDNHQAEFATAMAHDNPTIVQGHLG